VACLRLLPLSEASVMSRLGRPPRYDADAFLIEAFRIVFENRLKPRTQAELMRLAIAAYAEKKLPGGRPKEDWAKKKVRKLCRELEITFGVE
jgi:hypothetical protein